MRSMSAMNRILFRTTRSGKNCSVLSEGPLSGFAVFRNKRGRGMCSPSLAYGTTLKEPLTVTGLVWGFTIMVPLMLSPKRSVASKLMVSPMNELSTGAVKVNFNVAPEAMLSTGEAALNGIPPSRVPRIVTWTNLAVVAQFWTVAVNSWLPNVFDSDRWCLHWSMLEVNRGTGAVTVRAMVIEWVSKPPVPVAVPLIVTV
jgi:hypothetical protein